VALDDALMIKLLYQEGGAFLDYRSADGKSPLHRAALRGNINALTVCANPRMGGRHGISVRWRGMGVLWRGV
jgi:ankyrin repeat protein